MDRLTFKAGGFNAFSSNGLSTYGGMQKDASVIYIGSVADKLAHYEDLEEQGKLFMPPCAIGDTIYVIPSKANYRLNVLDGYKKITGYTNRWYAG